MLFIERWHKCYLYQPYLDFSFPSKVPHCPVQSGTSGDEILRLMVVVAILLTPAHVKLKDATRNLFQGVFATLFPCIL